MTAQVVVGACGTGGTCCQGYLLHGTEDTCCQGNVIFRVMTWLQKEKLVVFGVSSAHLRVAAGTVMYVHTGGLSVHSSRGFFLLVPLLQLLDSIGKVGKCREGKGKTRGQKQTQIVYGCCRPQSIPTWVPSQTCSGAGHLH